MPPARPGWRPLAPRKSSPAVIASGAPPSASARVSPAWRSTLTLGLVSGRSAASAGAYSRAHRRVRAQRLR
ncbi:hypothetical protein CNMCM8686_002272 [Aspergillus fumigatus]|nr:hypothetical protein CNMCM8686_002272 [Aspergillus fumigatus]